MTRSTDWMTSANRLLPTNCDDQGSIHVERGYGCATHGGGPDCDFTFPSKMIGPFLCSGIKQICSLIRRRVDRRLLCCFVKRAADTCQSEVLFRGVSACNSRQNVVDMKRRFLALLRQPTILTSLICPLNYEFARCGGDIAHCAMRSSRKRKSVKNSARSTSPSASSRS